MSNDGCGQLQLNLLRSWELRRDSSIVRVAARQQRLITALAIKGPRPRSYLIGLLWPENDESKAMECLRVSVHRVLKQVPGLLISSGTVLSLSEQVEVDLHRVREQIRELDRFGANGNAGSFLDLLCGAELLPGWHDDWVLFEQSSLRQGRLQSFHIIAQEALAHGDYESALAASEAALDLEPLYERAVGLLIRAERLRGNDASALLAFEKYQAGLKEEMGLVPSEAIQGLVADVPGSQAGRRNKPSPR